MEEEQHKGHRLAAPLRGILYHHIGGRARANPRAGIADRKKRFRNSKFWSSWACSRDREASCCPSWKGAG